ncbi:fimbria/pilus periplasmic chaperone [Yokenella regensburgei]|uniref:Fimbrial protein TcfA n=1 Tax=Yokenella regensburgei TaxID=158877 RepID=A0AB38FXA8_9ENTR|nr:fimbria/pilus periplasmic chaperone [Yokenella regensburgei]KFD22138.1 alpha-fimbriae chaperone protein [Yokenella regensburgei ATCC 49455]SQA63937.1 putative fimbrial protein TcfA [Yokenella regensburgei]SQA66047.1 putative fimbrial protein TcfA [Yokenella regensburgei]SUQ04666.1 putative fimbrial protein TcfA [Yokenella regensburgei]
MKTLIKKVLPVSLACFFIPAAFANMTVYPMAVSMGANGEGSVRVISKSNDVQYVRTKVFKITNPATPEEKEVEVSGNDGTGLVVMPPLFALPGGASKLVRMEAMDPDQKEAIYRVMFQSVPSLDDASTANTSAISSKLSVNLVWGVLVSVPPQQPVIKLTLSGDKHQLLNQGTQRVKITDIALCRAGQSGKNCQHKTDNRNIFPDGQYQLPSLSGIQHIEITYKDWIAKKNGSQSFVVN